MNSTNILFPVEGINRELDWRLMMATRLAGSGRRIFVSQHDFLERLLPGIRGGVYVGKNLFLSHFPHVSFARRDKIIEAGLRIVHLDEEGAFFLGGEENWRRVLDSRLDPNALPPSSIICTWGDFQRDHYRSRAKGLDIRTTGHPRFDLYKTEFRGYWDSKASEIAQRYGRFVLFNTNLSVGNNKFGIYDTFSGRLRALTSVDARADWVSVFAYQRRVHASIVESVARLSTEHSDLNFIIRPHPGEDFDAYTPILNGFPNVFVVHDGPVAPWILASLGVIHDGCTTAVEAFLAEKPVLSFRPFKDGPEVSIPNTLGRTFHSASELSAAIGRVKHLKNKNVTNFAANLFNNFRHESFEAVAQVIIEASETNFATFDPRIIRKAKVQKYIHDAPRSFARQLDHDRTRRHKAYKQAFPGFNAKDIKGRVARCEALLRKKASYTFEGPDLLVFEP